jgi:hypothetical protein
MESESLLPCPKEPTIVPYPEPNEPIPAILLTNSMQQSPYWEATSVSARQEIPHVVRNQKVYRFSPCLQESAFSPYSEPNESNPALRLSNSMPLSPCWEATSVSARQEISHVLCNQNVHNLFPCLQAPDSGPNSDPNESCPTGHLQMALVPQRQCFMQHLQ